MTSARCHRSALSHSEQQRSAAKGGDAWPRYWSTILEAVAQPPLCHSDPAFGWGRISFFRQDNRPFTSFRVTFVDFGNSPFIYKTPVPFSPKFTSFPTAEALRANSAPHTSRKSHPLYQKAQPQECVHLSPRLSLP